MSVSPKTLVRASLLAAMIAAPCLLPATRAEAQASPSGSLTPYPACTNKPTSQDSEAAHSAYLLGKRFFEESDYTSASHNFVDAFKLDCSKPELLLNIARANELLGNRAEAIHALETYLQRAPSLGPDEKAQFQRRIDNLKAAIAAQAPIPTAAPTPTVAPLPPPSASTASTASTAPPPPPAPAPAAETHGHTAWPWVATGVGGGAVVAGGILFLVGNGKVNSAESTCATVSRCTESVANSGTSGANLRTDGAVVFWAGVGIAGGGILWHFLEPTGPSSETPKASFVPVVGPGVAGGSVVGSF